MEGIHPLAPPCSLPSLEVLERSGGKRQRQIATTKKSLKLQTDRIRLAPPDKNRWVKEGQEKIIQDFLAFQKRQ